MDYVNITGVELIEKLNYGNQDAFDQISGRHWKALYAASFYIVKDQDAAMDLCQDIFVWLWQSRGILNMHNIGAYLRTAVKYNAANFIRHGKVKEGFFAKIELHLKPGYTFATDNTLRMRCIKK
jgi:DNA-directed RNA polymerase specialized sigma24 family protein